MARSKRAKACDISQAVRRRVWNRDGGCCIICGNPQAMPNSHYIRRSHGGLGIEENVVTMCIECHNEYDNGSGKYTEALKEAVRDYLKAHYPEWNEEELIYKKW